MSYSSSNAEVRSVRVTIPSLDKTLQLEFEPSRNREAVALFASGVRGGQRIEWQNGKLTSLGATGEYGRPHGVFHAFHDDASIMAEHEYRDGLAHGRVREWFPDGRLRLSGAYENGWPVGEWTQYFPEGGVFEVTEYFARSRDLKNLHRPMRRRRRCKADEPLVDVVVNGRAISGVDCKQ